MAELLVASFQRGGEDKREGRSRTQRILNREVDINRRDYRNRDRSDEARSDIFESLSLPSSSTAPNFSNEQTEIQMRSVDMAAYSAASARDQVSELSSQIHDLAQSMREQFDRIRYDMDKERARSRDEHEQERMEWRKEREALQNKIDQLLAVVAQQNKGKEHE
jgi:hypothetical protein